MPLVVPALRLFMVFMNIYDTFKTLKPPHVPSRRSGRSSIRATTQRKRDLKGCLAIWIVWSVFAAYEKTLDGMVGLLMPFYSEIKSFVIIFLLVTRAKGAEPIFLHVLKPLVKPYAPIVDSFLDIGRAIGDIAFGILKSPFSAIVNWWYASSSADESEENSSDIPSRQTTAVGSAAASRTNSNIKVATSSSSTDLKKQLSERPSGSERRPAPEKRGSSTRSKSEIQTRVPNPRQASGASTRSSIRSSKNDSSTSLPYNPKSASSTSLPLSTKSASSTGLPRNGNARQRSSQRSVQDIFRDDPASSPPPAYREQIDQEEDAPFVPYPPSPEPQISGLPQTPGDDDWRSYPAFPSAYPATPLPPQASLPMARAPSGTMQPPIPEGNSSESEEGSDVDDANSSFNVTLQTPYKGAVAPHASSSNSSVGSTALSSATGHRSTLRTRSNSDVSRDSLGTNDETSEEDSEEDSEERSEEESEEEEEEEEEKEEQLPVPVHVRSSTADTIKKTVPLRSRNPSTTESRNGTLRAKPSVQSIAKPSARSSSHRADEDELQTSGDEVEEMGIRKPAAATGGAQLPKYTRLRAPTKQTVEGAPRPTAKAMGTVRAPPIARSNTSASTRGRPSMVARGGGPVRATKSESSGTQARDATLRGKPIRR